MTKTRQVKPNRADAHVREAETSLARGNPAAAEVAATLALALAPRHARALLALARVCRSRRQFDQARACLDDALAETPGDREVRRELAGVLAAQGRRRDAITLLRETDPDDAEGWFELGCHLDADGDAESALEAARNALAHDPRHAGAWLLTARSHVALGEIASAAAIHRQLTRHRAVAAKAWFALLDLKVVALEPGELHRLEQLHADQSLAGDDRILVAFALGHAYEQANKPSEAFAAFEIANHLQSKRISRDPAILANEFDATRCLFAQPAPTGSSRGQEVVFLIGMPRSGSTLVEQVLAAHPDVVAGSELNDLPQVIASESKRRGRPFAEWAGSATDEDWQRLGEQYLERTRSLQSRGRFTDKYPENWLFVGAIVRMLPGARILVCDRDPIETMWSCYKQLFAPGFCEWSYEIDRLARRVVVCRRSCERWVTLEPDRCRLLSHEALLADLEAQARAALAFIGLDFDPVCLDFANQHRQTRTASAAQVRQPLRRTTSRSTAYGNLLAPFHDALARATGAAFPG